MHQSAGHVSVISGYENRKIARRWPNSGGAEAPSTEASRSKSSESARENCSPRVDNRASRSSSEAKASLSPVRLKALRTEARVVLNRTPCLGPRPSGSTVFGNARQIEIAGRQADGGSGAIGRARAVTGSVRDGRQTAKAPPAEQARGVSVRCERDPTLRGNVDRGSRSRRARRSPFIDKLAEPTPLPSFADPADAKRAGP